MGPLFAKNWVPFGSPFYNFWVPLRFGNSGELDEVVGEANRGKGGAEGGQEGVDVVPGFEEVVNAMQGKEVNVDEDVATGEGVDESNAGQSFVDDAEVQVAVVEKVFFYLASGINF